MSIRKPTVFQRAARVIATGVLATTLFSSQLTAAPLSAATLPLVASQVGISQPSETTITQHSITLPGGVTRVNIVPVSEGSSQMELGNLKIDFVVSKNLLPKELASVPDILSADSIEIDIRHAALLSVHEVFSSRTTFDLKNAPDLVANQVLQQMQKHLNAGYGGQSPYLIQKIDLEDACLIKFGMPSASCTTPFVSTFKSPSLNTSSQDNTVAMVRRNKM